MISLNEKYGKNYFIAVALQKDGETTKDTVKLEVVKINNCLSKREDKFKFLKEKEKELFPGYHIKDMRAVMEKEEAKKYTTEQDFLDDNRLEHKICRVSYDSPQSHKNFGLYLIAMILWDESNKDAQVYTQEVVSKTAYQALITAGRDSSNMFPYSPWELIYFSIIN